MNAPLPEEPKLFNSRLSPALAYLLYGMLALAAAAALLGNTRSELLPPVVRGAAPLVFGGFLLLFALYRFALVRARRYPAGKAFFQIGAGALFVLLLLPATAREFGEPPALRPLGELMADPDPSVRALACEVARHRADGRQHARTLAERLTDPAPAVRAEALASLRALAGADLGGEGADAAAKWRAWAEAGPAAP